MTSPTLGQSADLVSNLEAGYRGKVTELQMELIDVRMKAENQRADYQRHKSEHTSLQFEFIRTKTELKRLLDLRQAQTQETELCRSEYNKLQHDCKSLLDREREEHARELEERSISYVAEIESLKHSHKLEVIAIKRECIRSKGEMERERDTLQGQVQGLQIDVDKLKAAVEQQSNKVLLEKETEDAQREEWEERLRATQHKEESARRELQNMRIKLQQHKDNAETADLQQQDTLDKIREELRTAQAQAERSQHEAKRLEGLQVEWLEQKQKLQEQNAELQIKYCLAKEKMQRASLVQKKRKTQTETKETRLQDKIQLLKGKIEELELEAAAAKKRSSFLEERLQTQKRRKAKFENILFNTSPTSFTLPRVDGLLSAADHHYGCGGSWTDTVPGRGHPGQWT